jgi:TonB family protein
MINRNCSGYSTKIRSVLLLSFAMVCAVLLSCGQSDNAQRIQSDKDSAATIENGNTPDNLSAGEDTVFEKAVKMPEFPGGYDALGKFILSNVKYPAEAMEKKAEGKVMVSFIVTKEGKISDVKIKKSVRPDLDAEALRVVAMMPAWQPGENNNGPVNVAMVLPIQFKLQ